jgi:GIY-YIG domain-containing protein
MSWTKARLIARDRKWFDDLFDYEGPACYELGTGGPRGGGIKWHYVGETANERARISSYARSGSHLSRIINWHLRRGWWLYYRGYKVGSKSAAKRMQDQLLLRFKYDWNHVGNLGGS